MRKVDSSMDDSKGLILSGSNFDKENRPATPGRVL